MKSVALICLLSAFAYAGTPSDSNTPATHTCVSELTPSRSPRRIDVQPDSIVIEGDKTVKHYNTALTPLAILKEIEEAPTIENVKALLNGILPAQMANISGVEINSSLANSDTYFLSIDTVNGALKLTEPKNGSVSQVYLGADLPFQIKYSEVEFNGLIAKLTLVMKVGSTVRALMSNVREQSTPLPPVIQTLEIEFALTSPGQYSPYYLAIGNSDLTLGAAFRNKLEVNLPRALIATSINSRPSDEPTYTIDNK